jgi:hypothetical protein
MPKSKLRKNHKQKVEAWKKKSEDITKRFNNLLKKSIQEQNKPDLENGGVKITIE